MTTEQAPVKILTTDRDLLFCDIETTGLDPLRHEILEIAAVRLTPQLEIRKTENGWPSTMQRKIIPQHIETAEPKALEINGYNANAATWLTEALHPQSVMREFCELAKDSILLFWNSSFDWPFISNTLRALDLQAEADYHRLCVASMAWPLAVGGFVEKIKLEVMCERLGISNEGQHTAMRDVERMIEVYKRIVPPRRVV